ncbi:MAG: YbjN domain-containing protein [Alphaproteobacteria bacterium]|nr:YbjN domain-containing protein [Alphaproteobacteria bacterium]
MTRPLPRLAALALLPLLGGCAGRRLLSLENEVLARQLQEARGELQECRADSAPADFATRIDLALIHAWFERVGLGDVEQTEDGVLFVPIRGRNAVFQVTAQHFEKEQVLFLAVTDYLRLEQATSSRAMVLLLTQLASLNYDLLLGKFQLNPRSGEISLSMELHLRDGLGFETFRNAISRLVQTADERYPELARAAGGTDL